MTADTYLSIAGLVFLACCCASIWIARSVGRVAKPKPSAKPRKRTAKCPACQGPSFWRTCSAEVAPEMYTAAICDGCNRVGGGR